MECSTPISCMLKLGSRTTFLSGKLVQVGLLELANWNHLSLAGML